MSKSTCIVDDCDTATLARGMCSKHYASWRTSQPGGTLGKYRTGCSVEGCERKHAGRGYCQRHLYRLRTNGDPLVTRRRGSRAGADNPHRRGDDIAYQAMHQRLRREFGPARDFPCSSCGLGADEWAYQHSAPDERVCEVSNLPFSTDPDHYEPMCRPCHRHLDATYGMADTPRGRGVSMVKKSGRWRAYAYLRGKQHSAGTHQTEEEAEAAVTQLRRKLLTELEQCSR